jgi:acetyl esterase/lipase
MTSPRLSLTTFVLLSAAFSQSVGQEPTVMPLWPNGAPGFEARKAEPENVKKKGTLETSVTNVHNPSLTVYLPAKEKASGAGIVICPGGGHSNLAIEHEGHNVCRWLADNGIAGFVLYCSTKFDAGKPDASDVVERESSRPDFQIVVYPAIPKDLNFAKNNPPAFLACGNLDRPNISDGLATLYLNMKKAGINTELHIYASVGHGFGLREKSSPVRIAGWPGRVKEWLIDLDIVKGTQPIR